MDFCFFISDLVEVEEGGEEDPEELRADEAPPGEEGCFCRFFFDMRKGRADAGIG